MTKEEERREWIRQEIEKITTITALESNYNRKYKERLNRDLIPSENLKMRKIKGYGYILYYSREGIEEAVNRKIRTNYYERKTKRD